MPWQRLGGPVIMVSSMRLPILLGLVFVAATGACAKHHTLVGEPDAAADADVDAAELPIDCSTVGCGPAPICGQQCESPCGCCACAGELEQDGVTFVCAGDCFVADVPPPTEPCASSSECPAGWACCYPCGIPGCEMTCTTACSPTDPSCVDGCLAVP